jgi:hypothetical protein
MLSWSTNVMERRRARKFKSDTIICLNAILKGALMVEGIL